MRKTAALSGVLALLLLILTLVLYDSIRDPVPLIRGWEAPKTVLLSLRILIINILALSAFLILSKSIARQVSDGRLKPVGRWILIFIMVKMGLEFTAMFSQVLLESIVFPLLTGIIALLLYALIRHRYLFSKDFWVEIRLSSSEKLILTALLIAYIAVNIPVFTVIIRR